MPTMTAEQSRSIAKLYSELASALADYRFSHWAELTRTQRAEIESHEWTLLTYSSNMAARSIRLAGEESGTALAGITRATKRLTAAVRRVASVKRAFADATRLDVPPDLRAAPNDIAPTLGGRGGPGARPRRLRRGPRGAIFAP